MGASESTENIKDQVIGDGVEMSDDNVAAAPNNPPPSLERSGLHGFMALVVGYMVLLFGVYGFTSFTSPELILILSKNISGTLGIVMFGFAVFGTIAKITERISSSSFVSIDRKARGEFRPFAGQLSSFATSTLTKYIASQMGFSSGNQPLRSDAIEKIKIQLQESSGSQKVVERERVLGTAFEVYICSVVESLDKHISLTEEKGSNLLDRGLLFLFGGILYYVAAIAVWQAWAKYGEPRESVMYIGMFASSVVFLVCEFLAAWFLKQYRHYVDASLACLRVKSVYDRYLLSYYAVKEMAPEDDGVSEKLSRVLEVIKEDVMWPGHKDNMSNDFNYMLESMNSVHASLDKFKGLFDSKTKPAVAETQSDSK